MTLNNPRLELAIVADAERLAAAAADHIVQCAGEAIAARGRFTIALAGGSTPEKAYTLLARPERASHLDWSKIAFFFGDERCVPPSNPWSNFNMARRALFEPAAIPAARIHPIPMDVASPAASAAAYAQTLAAFFGQPMIGPPPSFDLILLGLGDDGHTASLFPGAAAVREARAWVMASPPGVLPPPVDRVTLTFPVLNAARVVLFLVAGANKAKVVHEILQGSMSKEPLPAARVTPNAGHLTWLIDEAAAGMLVKS